ncbi:hypothetical protein AB5I41_23580 [Sphingomonas sp. MMS24-JH45]
MASIGAVRVALARLAAGDGSDEHRGLDRVTAAVDHAREIALAIQRPDDVAVAIEEGALDDVARAVQGRHLMPVGNVVQLMFVSLLK